MRYEIVPVSGNTYYFDFPGLSIPFFRLSKREIILLDSGYARNSKAIIDYCHQEGIQIAAVIHSHAHPDHINGDHWLSAEPALDIYLSERDFLWALDVREQREAEKSDHDAYLRENNLQYLRELQGRFHDCGSQDQITVCGHSFGLISSSGHCLQHQMIITPDDVCYLGDILMYGRTLAFSKAPYTYDLTSDIAAKQALKGERHQAFIAAHEGCFPQPELRDVIRKNIDIYSHILREVARLEEAEPSLEVIEATRKLLERIGIHRYADVIWVTQTIRQYFDYYQETKEREFTV